MKKQQAGTRTSTGTGTRIGSDRLLARRIGLGAGGEGDGPVASRGAAGTRGASSRAAGCPGRYGVVRGDMCGGWQPGRAQPHPHFPAPSMRGRCAGAPPPLRCLRPLPHVALPATVHVVPPTMQLTSAARPFLPASPAVCIYRLPRLV
ncbi:hypothetical protein ZWY2020_007251 [Hordeum vulgare]|nr:hypothetical protein ZWY2020_007251 [Hordeum vulgare]